jgi:hypothetical protein
MKIHLYEGDPRHFKIATLNGFQHATQYHWLDVNVRPDYTDSTDCEEHIYSIDLLEHYEESIPPFMTEFIEALKAMDPDIAYFRFVF